MRDRTLIGPWIRRFLLENWASHFPALVNGVSAGGAITPCCYNQA
jgi:hypothetical protein